MSYETDPEVLEMVEELRQDQANNDPATMRRAIIKRTRNPKLHKTFEWMRDAQGQEFNYTAVRSGQRITKESGINIPKAGSNAKVSDLVGMGGYANPVADENGSLKARLNKMREIQ